MFLKVFAGIIEVFETLLYYQAHDAGRDDDDDVRRDKSDSPAVPTPPLQAGTVDPSNWPTFNYFLHLNNRNVILF